MAQTQQKTDCSFIPLVINKFIARVCTWRNRVPQGALERLELLDAKVSRAVLRGRAGGNTVLLLDSMVILSTGEAIGNPKFYAKDEKRLAKAQRRHAKKKKGSKNRGKARLKVARVHARINDRRRDYQHKLSTRLIRENQTICIESLAVKNMVKNHCLAKAISDVGWGEFVRQLEYKSQWYGRTLVKIDRFFPSSKSVYKWRGLADKGKERNKQKLKNRRGRDE